MSSSPVSVIGNNLLNHSLESKFKELCLGLLAKSGIWLLRFRIQELFEGGEDNKVAARFIMSKIEEAEDIILW